MPQTARTLRSSQADPDPSVWKLPLRAFVEHALEADRADPRRDSSTSLWTFTRMVRRWFPEAETAEAAFNKVDGVVAVLGGWDEHSGIDRETAYGAFHDAWKRIRFMPGADPVDQALAKADLFPIRPPQNPDRPTPMPKYNRFISVATWLQAIRGTDNSIMLPINRISEVLKTDPSVVSRWIRMAITDGYLELVKPHKKGAGGHGTAAHYRVVEKYHPWVDELISRLVK